MENSTLYIVILPPIHLGASGLQLGAPHLGWLASSSSIMTT